MKILYRNGLLKLFWEIKKIKNFYLYRILQGFSKSEEKKRANNSYRVKKNLVGKTAQI
jgi:hypothetical protein